MGGGSYSTVARHLRMDDMTKERGYSYYDAPASQIFAKDMNSKMSPEGITFRESRDSEEHPESFAIILSLDVTGSMGSIPTNLIKIGLPAIMQGIIDAGVPHPQLLFTAVGDSHYDRHPLQVGQFESSDALLDYWLENTYLEGGGGGNNGESYLLAHHFARFHTVTDCFEKRGVKGVFISIGDERYLPFKDEYLKKSYGNSAEGQPEEHVLINELKKTWDVFHIHTNGKTVQGGQDIAQEWKDLIGQQNVIVENNPNLIPNVIRDLIVDTYKQQPHTVSVPTSNIKDVVDTVKLPETEIKATPML